MIYNRMTSGKVLILLCLLLLSGLHALRIDSQWRKTKTTSTIPTDLNKPITSTMNYVSNKIGSSVSFGATGKKNLMHGTKKLQMTMVDVEKIHTLSPSLSKHKDLVEGKLLNGLAYKILPNNVPAGRFEAHLEILSGSAHELETQQGMAHLLEHVAYMGSPKRQLISGTGSRTNAYTDFHHTVFFAACPINTPDNFWKKPMLPMALDALLDVMTCKVDDNRLEKERAAVLSEASMVNKMEYRVECQILSALHSENRISVRFPIGKEHLIKTWTKQDVQLYHDIHYRPDNAVLFIVGNVDIPTTIATIQEKFGHLRPKLDTRKFLRDSGEYPTVSMGDAWRHFPPVTHKWSCPVEEAAALLPAALVQPQHHIPGMQQPSDHPSAETIATSPSDHPSAENIATVPSTTTTSPTATMSGTPTLVPTLRLFQHELLQAVSFHLFAKRPIEAITTEAALRRDIMRRITLSALQIRLNVQQRQDPLFTFVDFNQLNWPREGCAVCSLDLTTDTASWREAIILVLGEIRRLGLFGLTESELVRYKQASLSEAVHIAAQSEQRGNEDILTELMDAEAGGHIFLHPDDRYTHISTLLREITLEDVNMMARELCEHLSHADPARGVQPAAIVTCAPLFDRKGETFSISEREIEAAVEEALALPLQPLADTIVPHTLLTIEQLREKAQKHPPAFLSDSESMDAIPHSVLQTTEKSSSRFGFLVGDAAGEGGKLLGVTQRVLSNGMKVNFKPMDTEPQRVSMRVHIPGGRMLEDPEQPGAILLGARTMQEGGAFLNMTREDVELFCIDHQVMVEISATDEALVFDFASTTATPAPTHHTESSSVPPPPSVTGIEAVMQVAHIILTDFEYEEDAFIRAKQSLHEQYDSTVMGLESACIEKLMNRMTNCDRRFLFPNHETIDALDLPTCKRAIRAQLRPAKVEVSMAGDLPLESMQELALTYLGTVPPQAEDVIATTTSTASSHHLAECTSVGMHTHSLQTSRHLEVLLPDSEERAMGYLSGPAPNQWGIFADGQSIADKVALYTGNQEVGGRWTNPLFGYAALQILQEVANRRLFSVVREERQLTYDASFQLSSWELLRGAWYTVSVTSSPKQVQAALQACREALVSLKGSYGVMGDSIQSAKRILSNKLHTDLSTTKAWVERLSCMQSGLPGRDLRSLVDYESVLHSVTPSDIQLLIELFHFDDSNTSMVDCVGTTGALSTQ